MKRAYIIGAAVLAGCLIFFAPSAHSSYYGAPAAYTGAPGDYGACSTAGCHYQNAGSGTVTIEMLDNGSVVKDYSPGKKYTIHISTSGGSAQTYGFESTIKNATRTHVGTISVSDPYRTRLCSTNSPYITHNQPSSTGDFTYYWTAPATKQGPITIYAAVNFANNDGNNTGDHIVTTKSDTLTFTSLPEAGNTFINNIRCYPNPVSDYLTINYTLQNASPVSAYLYSLNGGLLQCRQNNHVVAGENYMYLEMNTLPKGVYILRINSEEGIETRKIEKL